jgi:hypothetical protein
MHVVLHSISSKDIYTVVRTHLLTRKFIDYFVNDSGIWMLLRGTKAACVNLTNVAIVRRNYC